MADKAPSRKQKKAATLLLENPGMSTGEAMRQAGYAPGMVKNPQDLTRSKSWQDLMNEYLPEESLVQWHKQLGNSHSLEHMVLGLGPKLTKDLVDGDGKISDEQALAMLSDANCVVRKIVHGPQARHVYYFAPDNRARKDALDMAYKLRGSYAPDKHVTVNIDVEPSDEIKKLAERLNAV